MKEAGITPYETTGLLAAARRSGEAGEGLVLCEVDHKNATIRLDEPMTDVLTGTEYEPGIMEIAPYGVHVLVKAGK